MRRLACTLLLALLPACTIYFGDDGDDDCLGAIADAEWGGDELRDPSTGYCVTYGGGGGGCGGGGGAAPEPWPDWASCYGACDGLEEGACLATPGCRAAYVEDIVCGPEEDCAYPSELSFYGCWGTAPSGPVRGECYGNDAYGCSLHDDCIAVYTQYYAEDDGTETAYSYCAPEPVELGCYSDMDCPGGYTCTADTECLPPPDCDDTGICEPVCYGRCVSETACAAVDCAPGYHCEETCYESCAGGDSGEGASPDEACTAWCDIACVPDNVCEDGTVCGDDEQCVTVCMDPEPTCDAPECTGACWSTCEPVEPACGGVVCEMGQHCEEICGPGDGACWIGCVPDDDPGPGACTGDVLCDSLPPACPVNTVAGIVNGCWSGYCIPLWACE